MHIYEVTAHQSNQRWKIALKVIEIYQKRKKKRNLRNISISLADILAEDHIYNVVDFVKTLKIEYMQNKSIKYFNLHLQSSISHITNCECNYKLKLLSIWPCFENIWDAFFCPSQTSSIHWLSSPIFPCCCSSRHWLTLGLSGSLLCSNFSYKYFAV